MSAPRRRSGTRRRGSPRTQSKAAILREPRIFSIPTGTPFLPTLADALVSGELVDGWPNGAKLSDATIYLPTRRAGRALAQILAERVGGRALLLPRIVPLGEADDAEPGDPNLPGTPALAPAIPPLERRLILTRLVQSWGASVNRSLHGLPEGVPFRVPGSPADAVGLAADLEGLMDSLATDGVPWGALAEAVDVEHSRYFALTLDFVRIAHEAWPGILTERGASDPARRRNAVLDAEAARIMAEPPRGPVVAAGSTGSIPSTARLLAAIARAPLGAVVLPGMDRELDEAGWRAIGGIDRRAVPEGIDPGQHGHPDYLLRRLVETHLGATRDAVRPLGQGEGLRRRRFLSQVMRPAETTEAWSAMLPFERQALADEGADGIAIVEAADEREEALAIAVALRETIASPGKRAALVTPDRSLARRVASELARWGIAVEDSGGLPLSESPAGLLARLAAEAAALAFAPPNLIALMAHPDVTLGWPRATVERAAAALEIAVLRGPAPRPGLGGIRDALALRREQRGRRDPLPRRDLDDVDWDLAGELVRRLADSFGEFALTDGEVARDRPLDLVRTAEFHAQAVELLTERAAEPGPDAGFDVLRALFDDLAAGAEGSGDSGSAVLGTLRDYPAFFTALARSRSLPPEHRATHRRVKILGVLEARLLDVDRMVLGALDETIWPPAPTTDSFLNRPMRLTLGLSPPERRIGQTAHDFVQALGTADAVITRARKRDGSPTVPSRFLERMQAFAGASVWDAMTARGRRYLDLAAHLDRPEPAAAQSLPALPRPAPRPGAERFPRRLSVTEIETLVRDPYAIYAKHVLRLEPLDRIAVPPSAADRGTILHDVLADFAKAFPAALPDHAETWLHEAGIAAFAQTRATYPELHALWWPAFLRFVGPYLAWERERRDTISAMHIETSGALELPIGDHEVFTLSGRADRIEIRRDGAAAILDYKTGQVPSDRVVGVGFSPQMTLQAAMLMRGGFSRVPSADDTPDLLYAKIGGRAGFVPPGPVAPARGDTRTMAEIVAAHVEGLAALVRRYGLDGEGYVSRPYPQYANRYSAYDHLARVKEWSGSGLGAGEEDGSGDAPAPEGGLPA